MDLSEPHPYDKHAPWDLFLWLFRKTKKRAPGLVNRITGWVDFIWMHLRSWLVRGAVRVGSDTFLKVMSSLPVYGACWFETLIYFGAISMETGHHHHTHSAPSPSPSVQPEHKSGFLGICMGVIIVLFLSNMTLNVFGYCYYRCCNWHFYKLVIWLRKNVVGKKVQEWVFSNFLMNLSVLLVAGHHAHIIICFGAFSIGLASTICLVYGRKDDMGLLDGLVTCFYICSLTFLSTSPHRLLVTLISVIVLVFLLICTTGPWHEAESSDDVEKQKGPRHKEGDENGDVPLQLQVSELRKEFHDVKDYVKSIKQCHCQKPQKPEFTPVEGNSGAYIIRGFENFNRNCYFTAVIQVLLCIPHLRVPFMNLNEYDKPLTRAIKELFIQTSLPLVSDCNQRFRNLYDCFCDKYIQFSDDQDQDSLEFLVCLLQGLQEEEEALAQTFPNSPLLVNSIFGGMVLNTTCCRMLHCRYIDEQKEPFLQLFLPIPVTGDSSRASLVGNKGAAVSLATCLEQYIKVESVSARRCGHCGIKGGDKSIRVIYAPLVLTISFKRFNNQNKKINDDIIFEETLDLRAYMHDGCVGSDKFDYHLIGVVVHKGSVKTGHCFAYVRGDKIGGTEEVNEDFTWYCLDDLAVRKVTLGEVLKSEAYMVFYEKSDSSVKQGPSYAKVSSTFGPPANHGSPNQRHRRSMSATSVSGKKVSFERPWKSPDEPMYSSWRNSFLEDPKGNGGGRWRPDG